MGCMDEPTFRTIFEPFRMAANAGNDRGAGLGLAVARRIVALLDGSIDVTSEVGQGFLDASASFDGGHAGTGLSIAEGLASARDIRGKRCASANTASATSRSPALITLPPRASAAPLPPPPPPPLPPPLDSHRSSNHRPIKLLAPRFMWKTSIMGKTNHCGEKKRTMMRANA